ncbi:MAG: nitroreductase family protein [Candidatus Aminicenantaceae bacterium]
MKNIFLSSILIFMVLNLSQETMAQGKNKPGLTVEQTFWVYINAIHNSDLESLFTTITDNEEFFFLTSRGKLIDSRSEYYKFHKDWFDKTGWEMPVELLETHEGEQYGYTNAIYHYKSTLPEKGKYILDSYFTLIFHKENNMWKVVADVCTPFNNLVTEADETITYTQNQTYLFDIIKNRRTVRKFKPDPVPEEHILKILEAAHFAPTAGNQQPWKFLVIRDREQLNQLNAAALRWYLENYKEKNKPPPEKLSSIKEKLRTVFNDVLSAPVYVAVLVDTQAKYSNYILYDGTLAAGYMMIAARALGYGTGFFTTFFPERKMKNFFKIPDHYKLICFTPIGIPLEWPDTPPKKKLDDLVVFDKF